MLEIYQHPIHTNYNIIEYQGEKYPFYAGALLGSIVERHLNGTESITIYMNFEWFLQAKQ